MKSRLTRPHRPSAALRAGALLALLALVALVLSAAAQQARQRREAIPTDEQLLQRAPGGVKVIPNIAYREGHERWTLDLAMPEERGDKPRPGIVFVHGGGWRSGDKRRGTFLRGALDYAQKGYVCITVNYRLTTTEPFPACVEDVKCAVRWLRAHADEYHLDPDHIGGYGNSAGAHLVAMLGLAGKDAGLEGDGPYAGESSLLQAVCCSATPTDFLNRPKGTAGLARKGWLLDGPEDTLEDRARKASPITYVDADAPPFLVVHGTADRTVDISQGDTFVEAMKKAGASDLTYIRIDDAGHGVFTQHQNKTGPAMEKFFARVLKE